MAGPNFPPFIYRAEYEEGGAGSAFLRAIDGTLDSAERKFKEFSAEAQKQLDAALSVKRNNFGSLDLGADQLRAAAEAQRARAIAAREVATATAQAAKAEGDYSQKARLALKATEALAIEEEQAARAALAHAAAAEQVQAQLNKQASQTQMVVQQLGRGTEANRLMVNSTRSLRLASVQAGQQLQDMGIMLYSGQKASITFAQQLPQLAFALSFLEGSANKTQDKIGKFATFLSGPWGLAVGVAVGVLASLVGKLFEAGDASDELKAKDIDLASAIDRHKASQVELNKAIDDYNKKQADAAESTRLATRLAIANAQAELADALAIREKLKATLEGLIHANVPGAGDAARVYTSQAAQNDADILRLQTEVNNHLLEMGELASKALDPLEAIRQKYSDINAELQNIVSGKNAGAFIPGVGVVGGTIKDGRFTGQIPGVGAGYFDNAPLDQVRAAVGAAQRAAEASERTAKSLHGDLVAFGAPIDGPLRITSGYGARSRPTAGASTNHLGIDYAAPAGTPVRAAMDGIVKFANVVAGYGNQIDISHGAGTDTRYSHLSRFAVREGQQVAKGDIIGYVGQTGIATGPHLHYEVLVNGKKVDPSKGSFPVDATKVAEEGERARAAAQRAAEQLQQLGERSAESVQRITERFNEQPKLVDQVAQAMRQLDQVISDVSEKKPINWEQIVADARSAKSVVEDALVRPFRDLAKESNQRLQIETLIAQGRDREAAALQEVFRLELQLGPLKDEQRAQVEAIVIGEQKRMEVLQRQREQLEAYLDTTRGIRSEIEAIVSGRGNIGNLGQLFRDLKAKTTVEALFGDSLRQLDEWVKQGPLHDSVDYLAEQTDTAGDAVLDFAKTVNQATAAIQSGPAGESDFGAAFFGAANDNGGGDFNSWLKGLVQSEQGKPIVVTAGNSNTLMGLTPERYFQQASRAIADPLVEALEQQLGVNLPSEIKGALSGAIYGYASGGTVGGVLGGLAGLVDDLRFDHPGLGKASQALNGALKGAQTGQTIAGVANSLGFKTSGVGASIGGAIGSALPIPGGDIIGAIAGTIWERILTGIEKGSVTLNGNSITGGTGRSSVRKDVTPSAQGVLDSLAQLAAEFGGTINAGAGAVSIGQREGDWRVDPYGHGQTRLSDPGVMDFGKDAQAAVMAATMDLIKDGVIGGIRASTQRLLSSGSDLQTAIQKAVDFESVFKELDALKDPLGAALKALDDQFGKLRDLFKEAGASADEAAKLEELYGLKRKQTIEEVTDKLTSGLKGLLADLGVNNTALSLRDRRGLALAEYSPLASRVAAGDSTAYDAFAGSARTLLDIERQISGSQSGYFDLLGSVTSLTQGALDRENAKISGVSNDNQAVVDAVQAQTGDLNAQLDAVNDNLGTMIDLMAAWNTETTVVGLGGKTASQW